MPISSRRRFQDSSIGHSPQRECQIAFDLARLTTKDMAGQAEPAPIQWSVIQDTAARRSNSAGDRLPSV